MLSLEALLQQSASAGLRHVKFEVQTLWQAQHIVNLEVQTSWQAPHFVNLEVQAPDTCSQMSVC